MTMRLRKRSFPFSKRKNCTAGIIRRKRIWWGESPILSPSTMLNALIPPCNIKLRNRQSRITGTKKRNPQTYENSGFGFGLFSFLHFDFSIFLFGCPVATKEVNHENVAWILGFRHKKRGRNLDVSSLSSKFRPLFTSAAGRSWRGGARERADDVFFATGIKRRRSKADFAPTWCARRDLNPHVRNAH